MFNLIDILVIGIFLSIPLINSKQIPLIGLFTRDNQPNNNSSSISSILDYALKHFETIDHLRTTLVIQREVEDIPCDMAIGTKMIFDMIHRQPRPLAIFSGSCQTVASAIAETAGVYNMTIVRIGFDEHRRAIFVFWFFDRLFTRKRVRCLQREKSIHR